MTDVLKALRNIGIALAGILLIVFIGSLERNAALIVTSTLVGVGMAYAYAAFEDKKPSWKLVAGWGAIGFAAGIAFSIAI